jgi:hypothetical protein
MILNLKDNFADYNVISNLLVSLSNLSNLMDDFLQDKTSANPDASAIPLQRSH